jgi:uncharacterized C2H2 Zn-finger protein
MNDLNEVLARKMIEEKIFRFKAKYHPNLVKNLSKEAYDLYLIRDSVCNQLFDKLKDYTLSINELKNFIKKKIKEIERKLHETTNIMDLELYRRSISVWEDFL